jgi:hypothetical protein
MDKIIENLVFGITIAALLAAFNCQAFSQVKWVPPPAEPKLMEMDVLSIPLPVHPVAGDTSERSMKVDGGVNLTLCVAEGTVKINGWNRNELRVFVQDGSKFGFNVLQKSSKTGDPVWVKVTGVETKNKYTAPTECISGGEIEIDLPVTAIVNIKGRETTTTIDSVKKANAQTIGGDITLRNISGGIMASTGQGDVTVEESSGAMSLVSATGNIVVFEAAPSEIGDLFSAKTSSGAISLQGLEHRQIEVNSISGSVAFSGKILNGGTYSLTTSNGSIRMSIPQDSSSSLNATYGYGSFSSEVPFKLQTENVMEGEVKNIVGVFGAGGNATIKLTTNNGSIGIKKL